MGIGEVGPKGKGKQVQGEARGNGKDATGTGPHRSVQGGFACYFRGTQAHMKPDCRAKAADDATMGNGGSEVVLRPMGELVLQAEA